MSQFFVSYMVLTKDGFEPRAITTPGGSGIEFNTPADIEDAAKHLSLLEAKNAHGGAEPAPDYEAPAVQIMGITRLPA